MKRLLSHLPKNARACIFVEPLWTLFGPAIFYYLPLYMKSLNISEIDMGFVNSVGMLFSFIFMLLASPITNRLGRRNTSIIFDLIAWTLPMLIWAFADNIYFFVIAAILNAVVKIVMVSWNLLLSEDTPKEHRPQVYSLIYLLGTLGGIATFAFGLIMPFFQIVPVLRIVYLVGCASMTLMFIIRWIYTDETAVGKSLMVKSKTEPFFVSLINMVKNFSHAFKDIHFFRFFLIFFIANASLSFNFFQIVFLKDIKGFSEGYLALIPLIGAASGLLLYFLLLPHFTKHFEKKGLIFTFISLTIAQIAFVFIPNKSLISMLIITGILQAAYFLLQSLRDAAFMNGTKEEGRSDLFALVQTLTMLASIPTGYLAGLLYKINEGLPFWVAGGLYFIGALVSLRLKLDD